MRSAIEASRLFPHIHKGCRKLCAARPYTAYGSSKATRHAHPTASPAQTLPAHRSAASFSVWNTCRASSYVPGPDGHHVLKHAQRTNDRTVHSARYEREQYQTHDYSGVQRQQSRKELYLRHPAEPCMKHTREIDEQQRHEYQAQHPQREPDFSQHIHSKSNFS